MYRDALAGYIVRMAARTPLYSWHLDHGAKIVEFAGWEMPLTYTSGAVAEHELVRRSAGLFDVSHMARFEFRGTGATAALQYLVSSNVERVTTNGSTYGLLCNVDGGVIDDLYLYRLPDHWLVVANAANREKDREWIEATIRDKPDVEFQDVSDDTAMFALQGPRAIAIADSLFEGAASPIPRFGIAEARSVLIGRTGYTGEDGVEFFVPTGSAAELWSQILETAARLNIEAGPVGLAARDSLRFEPGFALYGHELRDDITPLEARLAWACDLETEFVGRDALVKQRNEGVRRRLATIRMIDRGVPREGYPVLARSTDESAAGDAVGEVVTGMFAPTLDGFFANVYLPPALAKVGTDVDIEIRGRAKAARVVRRPLYTPRYR